MLPKQTNQAFDGTTQRWNLQCGVSLISSIHIFIMNLMFQLSTS